MRSLLAPLLILALVVAGCGGETEERAAAPATATPTPSPTATATPTPTATPKPELARARSLKQCARLWNEDALDDTFQVTANEFVADLAPLRVALIYDKGNCYVVMPIGGGRIGTMVAVDGRRPFHNPTRRKLKSTERVPYNARADKTGRITLVR
jgi:hypothetical protein